MIAGDWGTLAGPTVTSVTADDADNLDAVYGNGDTITVVFSEATNQPCGGVRRRNIDALFSLNETLGRLHRELECSGHVGDNGE